MAKGERIEPLGGGIRIIVDDMYHFSTDTILLADFAKPRRGSSAVDLGTGCGTIPLLWSRNDRSLRITAVELQGEACALLRRSVELNGLENIDVVNADLRDMELPRGCFDLVVCNPPYKESGSGIQNPDSQKLLARHEESCTFDEVCAAAKSLLQFGGRFAVCLRPDRLTDAMEAMRKYDLEPKRLRFVQQRREKAPKLFLLEGRRGGKRGGLKVESTLYIESDEMLDIYGEYKEGYLE